MLLGKAKHSKTCLVKRSLALTLGFMALGFCNSLQSDGYIPFSAADRFALHNEMYIAGLTQQGLEQSYSGMFWHSL